MLAAKRTLKKQAKRVLIYFKDRGRHLLLDLYVDESTYTKLLSMHNCWIHDSRTPRTKQAWMCGFFFDQQGALLYQPIALPIKNESLTFNAILTMGRLSD